MSRTLTLTASMIRSYKTCPRRYELEYIEMLKPAVPLEALETGSNYHARIEALLKGEDWSRDGVVGKMVEAFDRFVPWRDWDVAKGTSSTEMTDGPVSSRDRSEEHTSELQSRT